MTEERRKYIRIRGANEHNLKNIDLEIPRNELVVLTGLSGSGKSSLAFDTIYAEGQRRYMVSKARDDFPEPLSPVTTVNSSLGISMSKFFKLCSAAPLILINFLLLILILQ